MKKAFKYRIYPTPEQQVFMAKTFGCCRYVWNTLLAQSMEEYEQYKEGLVERPNVSGYSLVKELTPLRRNADFLKEVSANAMQQKLLDLGTAYQNFFKGKGYPKFKKRVGIQSFRLPSMYFSIDGNRLTLSRLETPVRIRFDKRRFPYNPSQVTISKDSAGRYFASFLCEVAPTRRCGSGSVGIDLGLTDLMTLSTGETVPNPRHLNRNLKSLVRLQRRLSRKVKGSRNRNKQRIKVARLYARIADTRKDYLHKLSTRLINENQVICLESLNVAGVIRNRRLARHIADVAWSTFILYLGYKATESGAKVILVDRFYPSTQTCSHCHHRLEGGGKLTLRDRTWTCPSCGTHHDRDHNAAMNILHEGMRAQDSVLPGTVALI